MNDNGLDSGLATLVRESVADVHAATPVAQIISRGRAVRTRRRLGAATLATVAAGSALAVGLTGVLGTRASPSPGAAPSPPGSEGTQSAGFVLTANTNGTLTLTMSQVLDPTALQKALTRNGVPALVKADAYCASTPAAPDPFSVGVLAMNPAFPQLGPKPAPLTTRAPDGQGSPTGHPVAASIANTKMVINPAAMPAGSELFFGYAPSGHLVSAGLIYTHSYTCSSQPPPAGPKSH